MLPAPDQYQELRDAMRDLCKDYPDEYWRKIDEARGYPEAFVDALTGAGWMANFSSGRCAARDLPPGAALFSSCITHARACATLGYFKNHCSLSRGSMGTSARSLKPTLFL